jgi:predicted nucleotidyltransferase
LTKTEIIQTLTANKQKLHDEFGLKRIGLFGSYAKDLQTEESDIDFLISFSQGKKKYRTFIALSDFLELTFKRKIELVTTESITNSFLNQINPSLINVTIA